MPIKSTSDFKKKAKAFQDFKRRSPRIVGNLAVQYFKMNFRIGGFVDVTIQKWRPRKAGAVRNKGRALLVNTGRGRRSIRIMKIFPGVVVVGTDVNYMSMHNTGGVINRQVTVRAHLRKNKRSKGQSIVTRHQRQMNTFIPKRQFMGNSRHLNKRIDQKLLIELRRIL